MSAIVTASKIAKAHLLKEKRPLNVSYFITNKCDLRCSYCTIPQTRGHHDQMTTDQIKEMLTSFRSQGMVKFSCSGGEPLLRPDLGEVMKFASDLGCITSITTNGRLLKKRSESLASLSTCLVSLDGNPDFHKGTKTNDVIEVLEGIAAMRALGVPVWLSCVLLEGSLKQMGFMIDIAREYDVKLLLQPFDNTLIEDQPFDQKLEQQKLMTIFDYVQKKAPDVIANTPDYIDFVEDGKWLTPDMCLAGERTCFINSNGDVFACLPILMRNGPTLNGLEKGWEEAFNGITLEGCKPCRFPCMAELYNTFSMKPRTWMHLSKNI